MKYIVKKVYIPEILEQLEAVKIGGQTLVAINKTKEPPYERGNCFDVKGSDGEYYRIVNFNIENLETLIDNKIVNLPVKISKIAKHKAVIDDERIPYQWYSNDFCEICCPTDLLPITQRLRIKRDETAGKRETRVNEKGEGYTTFK